MNSFYLEPRPPSSIWIQCPMASLSLELEDEPDSSDALLYAIMGDMFDLTISVDEDMLTAEGSKRNIWSWLSFVAWYSVDLL